MNNHTLKIAAPIAILILGVAAAFILASARRAPEREQKPVLGPLVEVIIAQPTAVATVVRGHGEVRAKTTVEVVPQVAGKVISMHPGLVAGGHFRAHEPLLTIEPRDYELAVERALAAVARADVSVEREQAEAEVALQEWEAIHPGEEPSSGLVVREPQVRQAKAELAAAQADLAVARLGLERTTITLPFDGIVESETIDLGQYVTIGKKLATVYGTAVAEVRVPLAERELAWFRVPSRPGIKGPSATVIANFGGVTQKWSGQVVRIEARVDTTSRMIPVVIAVPNPFKTRGNDIRTIEGEKLKIVPVTTVRTDLDTTYITKGLEPGDRVVISQLDAVTDGMTVRAVETTPVTSDAETPSNPPIPEQDLHSKISDSSLLIEMTEASENTSAPALAPPLPLPPSFFFPPSFPLTEPGSFA